MDLISSKELFKKLRKKGNKNFLYNRLEYESSNTAKAAGLLSAKIQAVDSYMVAFRKYDNVYTLIKTVRDNVLSQQLLCDCYAFQHHNVSISDWQGIGEMMTVHCRIQLAIGKLDTLLEMCHCLAKNNFTISKKEK